MPPVLVACAVAASAAGLAPVSAPGRCCGDPGLPACTCPPIGPTPPPDQRTERAERFPVILGGRTYELRFRMTSVVSYDGTIEPDQGWGCPRYASTFTTSERLEIANGVGRVELDAPMRGGTGPLAVAVVDGDRDRALLLVEPGPHPGEDLYESEFTLELFADRGGSLAQLGPGIAVRGTVRGLALGGSAARPERVALGPGETLDLVMETLFDATCPVAVDWQRGIDVPRDVECEAPVHGAAEPDHDAEDGRPRTGSVLLFGEPRLDSAVTLVEVPPGTAVSGSRVRAVVRQDTDGVYELDREDLWLLVDVGGHRGWIHRTADFYLLGLVEDRC